MLFGKKSGSYTIDMCSGPIVSRLLLFAGPLMLSSILQLLFNAADVIVVGTISGICDRVLRIKAIGIPELIHERNKAVHI